MAEHEWVKEFPGVAVVSDTSGIIIEMNDKAVQWFANRGGKKLLGKSLLEVHPEAAQGKIRRLLETKEKNVYTIGREGVRTLIYQSPWYRDGKFAGLMELLLDVPSEIPHHVRAPK
ncbi:MAG: PAS domain-containing protein [Dehalococcoidia bacterium]